MSFATEDDYQNAVRKGIEAALLRMPKENKPAPTVQEAPKENPSDHVFHCPECFEAMVKKLKASPYICDDCESPLGDEDMIKKLPVCPFCGGTHPRKR